jgi:enamine deaminase RidA (YjgF/YER057c/UK114 family)
VKREIIRVEPLSTYLENWKAPTSAVTRSGDTIYASGFAPFEPDARAVAAHQGRHRASDSMTPAAADRSVTKQVEVIVNRSDSPASLSHAFA